MEKDTQSKVTQGVSKEIDLIFIEISVTKIYAQLSAVSLIIFAVQSLLLNIYAALVSLCFIWVL